MPWSSTLTTLFIALSFLFLPPASAQGNTDCVGDALDWYTNAVGETPCMTYQRLRQICNSEYQVPVFRTTTPGDNCDDQVSSCCCNSIAWGLSMLCMNCQQDENGGDVNGIDAAEPAYYKYRISSGGEYCGDGTNQSLPTNIQVSVCNEDIKLDDFLYQLFWNTGAWYYTYSRETAQAEQVANKNDTFMECSSVAGATPTLIWIPTGTQNPMMTAIGGDISNTSKKPDVAAIAGGAAGGACLFALVVVLWCRRRRARAPAALGLEPDNANTDTDADAEARDHLTRFFGASSSEILHAPPSSGRFPPPVLVVIEQSDTLRLPSTECWMFNVDRFALPDMRELTTPGRSESGKNVSLLSTPLGSSSAGAVQARGIAWGDVDMREEDDSRVGAEVESPPPSYRSSWHSYEVA